MNQSSPSSWKHKLLGHKGWGYRTQQLLILLAHLVLLKWMLYTLGETGSSQVGDVLLHFLGMSLYGACLIRGTAAWARYHYIKESRQQHHGH